MIRTIEWTEAGVVMLDQRILPGEETYLTFTDYRDVAEAIRALVIRGAPAIGVAAAMGAALGVQKSAARTVEDLDAEFRTICVNLFWAI
jgi:methylthioribose-1-phosphate isomerase